MEDNENFEMLRFVPGHLKTKTLCKNAVKKLPFTIKYVPDRYKTKEMWCKLELRLVRNYCKTQKMWNKAIATYPRSATLGGPGGLKGKS